MQDMDLYNRLDELSHKIDHLLASRHSAHPSFHPAQSVYSSPTHFVSEHPVMYQFPESRYDQVYQDQTQMDYRPGHDPYLNDYHSGWGAQPDFTWEPHPVVTPATHSSQFVDTPYYGMPYPQYQPSPITYSPSFEEKVLQALDRIENLQPSPPTYTPSFEEKVMQTVDRIENLQSSTQSLTELDIRPDQFSISFTRDEVEELPIQPESNLEGPYQTFNNPPFFLEQSTITLGNSFPFLNLPKIKAGDTIRAKIIAPALILSLLPCF